MNRILIVEDEQHLAQGLRFNLEAEGYQVRLVESGEEALELLKAGQPVFDLILLDVMLPGKNGFAVMSEMRNSGQFVPTLMLTARGHSDDILQGFAAGADDYLTKPFELSILIARIRGLLRRREWLQSSKDPAGPASSNESFIFGEQGDKKLNFELLELVVGAQVYPLTMMEAKLLRFLMQSDGKPVSRKTMLEEVWGLREDTDTRPIDNFIVKLRRYIEDDPTRPRHLLTVRSVGYRFIAVPAQKS
jgi:DNA-binding response OmpR family regulator